MTLPIDKILAQIAKLLEGGWVYIHRTKDSPSWLIGQFTNPKITPKIDIRKKDSRSNKVTLVGDYPKARDGQVFPAAGDRPDSISFQPDRDPKIVVADITKRFVVPYLKAYNLGEEMCDIHNQELFGKTRLMHRLCALIGTDPTNANGELRTEVSRFLAGSSIYLTLQVNGPQSVQINVAHIKADLADKIISTILTYARENTSE